MTLDNKAHLMAVDVVVNCTLQSILYRPWAYNTCQCLALGPENDLSQRTRDHSIFVTNGAVKWSRAILFAGEIRSLDQTRATLFAGQVRSLDRARPYLLGFDFCYKRRAIKLAVWHARAPLLTVTESFPELHAPNIQHRQYRATASLVPRRKASRDSPRNEGSSSQVVVKGSFIAQKINSSLPDGTFSV